MLLQRRDMLRVRMSLRGRKSIRRLCLFTKVENVSNRIPYAATEKAGNGRANKERAHVNKVCTLGR